MWFCKKYLKCNKKIICVFFECNKLTAIDNNICKCRCFLGNVTDIILVFFKALQTWNISVKRLVSPLLGVVPVDPHLSTNILKSRSLERALQPVTVLALNINAWRWNITPKSVSKYSECKKPCSSRKTYFMISNVNFHRFFQGCTNDFETSSEFDLAYFINYFHTIYPKHCVYINKLAFN